MAILVLIALYQMFTIRVVSNDNRMMKIENQKTNHHLRIVEEMLTNTYVLGNTLPFTDSLVDESNNVVSLQEISNDAPILIFRFSRVNCSKCIVEQIDIIKKFTQRKDIEYLMICDYNNMRELGLFKRTNGIIDQVYDCSQLLLDENKTPCFFVYCQGRVVDVFFPDDDFKYLTDRYLDVVSKKYF